MSTFPEANAVTALLATLGLLMGAFVWWRWFFFHRNPVRVPPSEPGLLSAADGVILYREVAELRSSTSSPYHQRIGDAFGIDGRWTIIATYLGIFDVHVVRSPDDGTVHLVRIPALNGKNESMGASYFAAALRRPLPLGQRGYLDKNEFLGIELVRQQGPRVLLVLMADWWIDQIEPWVKQNENVKRGQALGRILMGSQVDVWIEGEPTLTVDRGQRVRAGVSHLSSN